MTEREKIADRIRKLMELGDTSRNNSVAEAAAAVALAQKLMFEHKISSVEVEDTSDEDPIIERDLWSDERSKQVTTWRAMLLNGVAVNNWCKLVKYPGRVLRGTGRHRKGRLVVYGRQGDVEAVSYMYQYLTREVERLCQQEARKTFDVGEPGIKRWCNSFRIGAADTVYRRLTQERRESEARAEASMGAQSTALVRKADAAVSEYVKQKHPRLSTSHHSGGSSGDGYRSGAAAGERINLRGGKGLNKAPGLLS